MNYERVRYCKVFYEIFNHKDIRKYKGSLAKLYETEGSK